jgi:hypothetical protein
MHGDVAPPPIGDRAPEHELVDDRGRDDLPGAAGADQQHVELPAGQQQRPVAQPGLPLRRPELEIGAPRRRRNRFLVRHPDPLKGAPPQPWREA